MPQGKAPLWVRAGRVYREKGPAGVWFGALSRFGYRRLVLLGRRLDEPVPRCTARVEAEIRRLRPEDEAAFVGLGASDADAFRHRLELGHQCWGAWVSGRLCHFAWLAYREAWVEYLRCRVVLDDGVVYAYNAYTDPECRAWGLSAARQSVCLPRLREEGHEVVLAAILPDNPSALPPCLKVGYRRIGVVRALGAGRRPRILVHLDRDTAVPTRFTFQRALPDPPR